MSEHHERRASDPVSDEPLQFASLGDVPTIGGPAAERAAGEGTTAAGARPLEIPRYPLRRLIARGGMGEVWEADDERLGRRVAIKLLRHDLQTNTTAIDRFREEAQTIARLEHNHIVRLYDWGQAGGRDFLVMQFVSGENLAQRIRRHGPLPWQAAIQLVRPLCDALHYAHQQGVVHRDIKPGNILVVESQRGPVGLITDFGLAHRLGKESRTGPEAILGTPWYMAPEQLRNPRQAGPRSDLWSLAATLYQLTTGYVPQPIDLELLPEVLRSTLREALRHAPHERQATLAEFGQCLDRLAAEDAPVDASDSQPHEPSPPASAESDEPTHALLDLCGWHQSGRDCLELIRNCGVPALIPVAELEALYRLHPETALRLAEALKTAANVRLIETPRGQDPRQARQEVLRVLALRGHRPRVVPNDSMLVTGPPASVPPTSVPPTSVPPASVPPASVPPTSVPPTSVLPTSVPPACIPSPHAAWPAPEVNGTRSAESTSSESPPLPVLETTGRKATMSNSSPTWTPARLLGDVPSPDRIRLLVDTSSLMQAEMPRFARESLIPWARSTGQRLIAVPREVVRELGTLARCGGESQKCDAALRGIQILDAMKNQDVLTIFETGQASEKQAADDVFIAVITQLLLKYDVILLTQDRSLAATCQQIYDAKMQSDAHTGRRRRFTVSRLRKDDQGQIRAVRFIPNKPDRPPGPAGPRTRQKRKSASSPPESEDTVDRGGRRREPPTTQLRTLTDERIGADPLPGPGDVLLGTSGTRYPLGAALMAGGEGTVYHLDGNTELIAKLYHPEQLVRWRMDKLALMVDNPVRNRGVAWPCELVENVRGQPVGFLMPKVSGARALGDCVFNVNILQDLFPHWTRRHLVQLARNLANVVHILHKRNEVIGDLNPANVLVHEEEGQPRVKLVDADSWQFAGYPSPVGMQEYTHPSLRGRCFTEFLRDQVHDEYALAIILFQILFAGRHPFSAVGDQSLADAMKLHDFPYPLGTGQGGQKVPKGFAWKVWTHVAYPVQRSFHDVFTGRKSISAKRWVEVLDGYHDDIVAQRLDMFGNDDAIKPALPRVPRGREGEESITLTCGNRDCNASETFYGSHVVERMRSKRFYRCRECREREAMDRQAGQSRLCGRCGTVFSLPIWFEDMLDGRLAIPDLCSDCGGFRPEIPCTRCDKTFTSRQFDQWQFLREKPDATCRGCHTGQPAGRSAPSRPVPTPPSRRPTASVPRDRRSSPTRPATSRPATSRPGGPPSAPRKRTPAKRESSCLVTLIQLLVLGAIVFFGLQLFFSGCARGAVSAERPPTDNMPAAACRPDGSSLSIQSPGCQPVVHHLDFLASRSWEGSFQW